MAAMMNGTDATTTGHDNVELNPKAQNIPAAPNHCTAFDTDRHLSSCEKCSSNKIGSFKFSCKDTSSVLSDSDTPIDEMSSHNHNSVTLPTDHVYAQEQLPSNGCFDAGGNLTDAMNSSESEHVVHSKSGNISRNMNTCNGDFTNGIATSGNNCVSQVKRRNVNNGAVNNDLHGENGDKNGHANIHSSQSDTNGFSTCKSCETEQSKTKTDIQKDKDGLLTRSSLYLQRTLSLSEYTLPDWWTEPEYMVHAKPQIDKTFVHHHADSLFSTSSGFTNYYGILNLCLLLLVLGNARLFLENIIKYGILINFAFTEWFFFEPYNWPNLLLTCSLVVHPMVALITELLLAKSFIGNKAGCTVYIVNLFCLLVTPAAVIYYLHPIIAFSLVTLGIVTICFLKLISYGHTNYWCREQRIGVPKHKRRKSLTTAPNTQSTTVSSLKDTLQFYPSNLNVKDIAYFMFAPTLCYELNFPRSARVRKRFLLKRILEMVFLSWLCVGLLQQWIVPAVENSRQPLAEMEVFKSMERLLKLAIPNHLIWLIFFYWFFHSTLNVVAELLRFGDREFYRDWWNAEGVAEFWQNWNIPVHRFAIRHIYKPLLRRGASKVVASVVVFLLSAFFHEYLVSVPLRMFKIWAFSGMLMQVPIAFVTMRFVRGKWGNIIMWLALILGQPVAILAYFHDYYIAGSRPFMYANGTSSGQY